MPPNEQDDNESPFGFNVKAHHRGLEAVFKAAPVNQIFESTLEILNEGEVRIYFPVDARLFHAGGGLHSIVHYKALSDAAFYAANSLFTDRFLITSSFNLTFTNPVISGALIAEGRWVSGRKRILIADSRLIDEAGNEVARGTGTFAQSSLLLTKVKDYLTAAAQ